MTKKGKIMRVCFEVEGRHAMFTEPLSRVSGEKQSLQIPTREALKGIAKSIYWKPTFVYEIEKVRVMNPIRFESMGVRLPNYKGGNDLATYLYLKDVRYQVQAVMKWNMNRPEYAEDRIVGKHLVSFADALAKGGRRDVCLGTRECQAFVSECSFGEGSGAYDDADIMGFGLMYYGITYPDEGWNEETRNQMSMHWWMPEMRNGIIEFPPPSRHDAVITRKMKPMKMGMFERHQEEQNGISQ